MSTLVSPFSADERKPEHEGVQLFDMILWQSTNCKWIKAMTHSVMEHNAEMLSSAGWVVLDIREQYMCGSEENDTNDKGFAQVYLREDKETQ